MTMVVSWCSHTICQNLSTVTSVGPGTHTQETGETGEGGEGEGEVSITHSSTVCTAPQCTVYTLSSNVGMFLVCVSL